MALAFASCSARKDDLTPQPLVVAQPEPSAVRELVLEPTSKAATAPPPPAEKRVILVTLDGVRWQDVVAPNAEMELLPRVYEAIAEGGVIVGANTQQGCAAIRATSGSNVSLPGYIEILGGRPTGCTHNYCPTVTNPTVLDDAAKGGVAGVASFASWQTIGRAVSNGHSVGIFVSAGAGDQKVDPFPAEGGNYRPDRLTAPAAVAYFRANHPRMLHVGLGDTDEFAHHSNLRGYVSALKEADVLVGNLMDAVSDAGLASSTTFIVTTDHGRAANFRDHGPGIPASARSFVIAFGGGVKPAGVTCSKHDMILADVGATVRALLDLPPDKAPNAGKPIDEIVMR